MKGIKCLVSLLLCLLMLTGCARERKLSGEVKDIQDSGFTLITDDDKQYTINLTGETGIFSWLETVSQEDLLSGEWDGIFVTVQYKRSGKDYIAQRVLVDGLLTRNAMQVSDGTAIHVLEQGLSRKRVYMLEDGTELLWEREPTGPEHVHAGAALGFDDLNEAAQKNIKAYFDEKGLHYDISEMLEEAYTAYCILGGEFQSRGVSQDIVPTASNDRIICFLTDVVLPGWRDYSTSVREGAVFDIETGEHISGFDLFACSEEELEEFLIGQLHLEEEIDQDTISLGLKPENFVLHYDGSLEVYLSACNIPNHDENLTIGMVPDDALRSVLQPWAVMESEKPVQ